MAVITDDSSAHEKTIPVDLSLIAYGTPTMEEGFSIDKTNKKFYQPCNIDQDSEEKSPSPETATESPIPPPAKKMKKKKRQRKHKRKKIKAVVVIKGRRTKPGNLTGKYRLKLPKTFAGNCLPVIALCLLCQCHPVHSVTKTSVEDKNEDVAPMTNDEVSKTSVEDKKEDVAPMRSDEEICDNVPVTDFPIVIKQDDRNKTFLEHEVILCPQIVGILKSCSACFKNKSLLEISCRKNGDVDNGPLWVEHGKGHGISDYVELNSKACHKIETGVRERQSNQSDGKTSAENSKGSEGISWRGYSLLVVCIMVLPAILGFVASKRYVKCKKTPLLPSCCRVSKMDDL